MSRLYSLVGYWSSRLEIESTNGFKPGSQIDIHFVIYNLPKDTAGLERQRPVEGQRRRGSEAEGVGGGGAAERRAGGDVGVQKRNRGN